MPTENLIGKTIGGFTILREIGRGGMAVVYEAREEELGRIVALKTPSAELAHNPAFPKLIDRFKREARAAASVTHPNICPIYTMGEDQGVHYFAMELVRGTDLADYLKRHGPLAPERALWIASQVALGLRAAHEAGMVHRDIKPANIILVQTVGSMDDTGILPLASLSSSASFVFSRDSVRILDFGLAKWEESQTDPSSTKHFLGTLQYASPEQCSGRDLDARSDLYSLGVTLYELLTGSLPYQADTPAGMLGRIQFAAPSPLGERLPDIDPAIERIVSSLLAKQPENRIPHAQELLGQIEAVMTASGKQPPQAHVLTLVCAGAPVVAEKAESLARDGASARVAQWRVASREILREFPESIQGEESLPGDSRDNNALVELITATFTRPSDALRYALLFRARLESSLATSDATALPAIGIHMGEVEVSGAESAPIVPEATGGCATFETARRVMDLAESGQILMTLSVFDLSRGLLKSGANDAPLRWLAHGPYVFKGADEPIGICEVGIGGVSPLSAPPDSPTARRMVAAGDETMLGWRPGVGQTIPQRPNWVLTEQRGEGGFGEVWLATHAKTHDKRVFKFCFESERVQSLRREVTLFRLLKETLGSRDDITQILDWQFEEPPFFIESVYTEEGSLAEWAERQGSVAEVPLETRLEIVAQAADAVAAAHSVGVLHKDIKPANILIGDLDGRPRSILTDFGIGQLTRRDILSEQGITQADMTGITLYADESSSSSSGASATGTRAYMAPELFEGRVATTQSDVFAIGVLLYQMVSGDLSHALAIGWERHVEDDFLRDDIRACVEGDTERRLAAAEELARRLRRLDERRAEREADRQAQEEADRLRAQSEKQRFRRRISTVAAVVAIFLSVGLAWIASHEADLRQDADDARDLSEKLQKDAEESRVKAIASKEHAEKLLYRTSIHHAANYIDDGHADLALDTLWRAPERFRDFEWGYLLNNARDYTFSLGIPNVQDERVLSAAPSPDGQRIACGGQWIIRVFNANNGHQLARFPVKYANIEVSQYSPDGSYLLAQAGKEYYDLDTVILCDARTGELIWTATPTAPDSGAIISLSFNQDGSLLNVNFIRTTLFLDALSGKTIGTIPINLNIVKSGTNRSDGKSLILYRDGRLETMGPDAKTSSTLETLEARKTIEEPGKTINEALKRPQEVLRLEMEDLEYGVGHYLALNPGETLGVAPLGIMTAQVFDLSSGTRQCILEGHGDAITDAEFSPDGRYIATSSKDKTVRIWDVATGKSLRALRGHRGAIGKVRFMPDGRRLLTVSEDGTAKMWDWRKGLSPFAGSFSIDSFVTETYGKMIPGAAWSPDGKRAIMWNFTAKVTRILAVPSGRPLLRLTEASRLPRSVCFSPDGERILTASPDSRLYIQEARTGKLLRTLDAPTTNPLNWAHYSSDGRRIVAVAGTGGRVRVWNVESGEILRTFDNAAAKYDRVSFSPDGRRIVFPVGLRGLARVWSVETGERVCELKGHASHVGNATYSPDGRRIATASEDGTARVWDAETGKTILVLRGHGGGVFDAQFSPDGRHIATASADRTAKVWDASSGEELLTLTGHTGIVTQAQFSPDGQSILTGSADVTLRIWKAAPWKSEDLPGDPSKPWKDRFKSWRTEELKKELLREENREALRELLDLEKKPIQSREETRAREQAWRLYLNNFESVEGIKDPEADILRQRYARWAAEFPPVSEAEKAPPDDEATHYTENLGLDVGLEMVWVQGGEFVLGDFSGEDSKAEPEATPTWLPMAGFWTGKHEVTIEQFERFVSETAHVTDAEKKGRAMTLDVSGGWPRIEGLNWRDPGYEVTPDHPAVCVSWRDAMAFCDWLSKRAGKRYTLPTEAQAAHYIRPTAGNRYPWGNDPTPTALNENTADLTFSKTFSGRDTSNEALKDGFAYTAPAGSFPPNPWGLHDTLGNASEWSLSSFAPFPYRDGDGRNESEERGWRILTIGAAVDKMEASLLTVRLLRSPDFVSAFDGFRVVRND